VDSTGKDTKVRYRLALAVGASLALSLPFLLWAWLEGTITHASTVLSLAMLGGAIGPFGHDLRTSSSATAVGRLATAIPLLLLAFFGLAVAFKPWSGSGATNPVLLAIASFVLVGPAFAAAASGAYTAGRWHWILVLAACVVGIPAWLWVSVRFVMLASSITIGVSPGRLPLESIYTDPERSSFIALSTLPMVAQVALWLRRARTDATAAGFALVAAGVALQSWSYRFPAALAIVAVAAHTSVRLRPVSWRGLATLGVAILLLSMQPVDVSLRWRASGPGLSPTIVGLLTGEGVARASRNDVVPVGGCSDLYNAPRWIWVW
jgi:hypothetical protein